MPSQFAAQTMPLGQLFAGLHAIQHAALPAPLLVGAARSQPLARGSRCRNRSGWRRWRDRRVFPRHHAVHRGRASLAPAVFTADARCWKWSTVSSASRRSRFCSASSAISMQKTAGKPNERVLAAIGTGQGGNARRRLSLREADEAFFRAHVRNLGATSLAPVSDNLSPAGGDASSRFAITCMRPCGISTPLSAGVSPTSCSTNAMW